MELEDFVTSPECHTVRSKSYRDFRIVVEMRGDGGFNIVDETGVHLDDVGGISYGHERRPWWESDDALRQFAHRVRGLDDERGQAWVGIWLPVESVTFVDMDKQRAARAADEVVELTGDDIPYHLRADAPPLAICDRCERQSWAESDVDQVDRMPQPSGRPCGGRLWGTTKPNLAQAMHYAEEGLHIDGGHHKQWYLEEILKALGAPLPPDTEVDRGIPG